MNKAKNFNEKHKWHSLCEIPFIASKCYKYRICSKCGLIMFKLKTGTKSPWKNYSTFGKVPACDEYKMHIALE